MKKSSLFSIGLLAALTAAPTSAKAQAHMHLPPDEKDVDKSVEQIVKRLHEGKTKELNVCVPVSLGMDTLKKALDINTFEEYELIGMGGCTGLYEGYIVEIKRK